MLKFSGSGIFIFFILTADSLFAQNGKLINSTMVSIQTPNTLQTSIREQVDIKSITYMSDNLKVKGYIAIPKKGEKLPCVIWNRGGNGGFAAINDNGAIKFLGTIASWGYIVVASQYRGNSGGEGKEEFGGADVNDILNLIPLLESIPQADTKRIGMYGISRGCMMTYLALTKTERISGAIINSGMADLFDSAKRRPEMIKVFETWIPDFRTKRDEALTVRSPIKWVEKINKYTPILLMHGSADWRVYPGEAFAMANAFFQNTHPFRLVIFEGAQHGLSEFADEESRLTKDWLDRYVRDQKPWPSLEPHGG